MAKLTKTQLIDELAKKLDVSKADGKRFLDAFQEVVIGALSKGAERKVAISGFCNFELKKRKARWGRNPQTGEKIKIKAKKVVKITPLKGLKEAVL